MTTNLMLLIDVTLLIVVPLLGNEIRHIIDENHEERARPIGRHGAASGGDIGEWQRRAREAREAHDRLLFARIAEDFRMNEPTVEFAVLEGSVAG